MGPISVNALFIQREVLLALTLPLFHLLKPLLLNTAEEGSACFSLMLWTLYVPFSCAGGESQSSITSL